MIDGVSANIGISSTQARATLFPARWVVSAHRVGPNSLVSVDAMQEFRIQTSTFAPEFGRTPGGQISIGHALRDEPIPWHHFRLFSQRCPRRQQLVNGFTNVPPLPKAEERQNDFGGTFSGPIFKNRTFFFFSYEGPAASTAFDISNHRPGRQLHTGPTNSRQNAIPAMQPFMNAFPLPSPNSPEIPCDPSTDYFCPHRGDGNSRSQCFLFQPLNIDAASLRVDHRLNDKLILFGRYNYAPSGLLQRPGYTGGDALNVLNNISDPTQTATLGATWTVFSCF